MIKTKDFQTLKSISSNLLATGGGVFAFLDNEDSGIVIFPGFCDVHVHFREPGFFYKESIKTGSFAGASGGYTSVCTMPNLKPVPDSKENILIQKNIIDQSAVIDVYPFASITINEEGKVLSNMEELASLCVGFSDDGRGVDNDELMESAMLKAKSLNKILSCHCEVKSLLYGGYIHDGEYARLNGHKGISSESEWKMIERDIALAKKTGAKYHVCHISTKESVDLIRKAKKEGVDITCETAPHYLVLTDMDIKDEGRFKMNPPLRGNEDRLALIEGLIDGTIDMIATDHAPHSLEEKSRGLKGSMMGVVGLETAFSVLYTHLVKKGVITLKKLIELMAINPRKRFNLPLNDGFTVFDLNKEYVVNPEEFNSKGRSTPFEGEKLYGKCLLTSLNGKIVYNLEK